MQQDMCLFTQKVRGRCLFCFHQQQIGWPLCFRSIFLEIKHCEITFKSFMFHAFVKNSSFMHFMCKKKEIKTLRACRFHKNNQIICLHIISRKINGQKDFFENIMTLHNYCYYKKLHFRSFTLKQKCILLLVCLMLSQFKLKLERYPSIRFSLMPVFLKFTDLKKVNFIFFSIYNFNPYVRPHLDFQLK